MKVVLLIPTSKFAKNVARDLIYGCWCKGKRIAGIEFPPISQLQVVTVLRQVGIDAQLYDAVAMKKSTADIKEDLVDCNMVIILTSTMTVNEDAAILSELKRINPKIITAVYGAHPTFMSKYTVSKEGIDIAVRREPEFIIRDLALAFVQNKDWHSVKGISFKLNGEYVCCPDYEFIENLDSLPIPDRTLLPGDIDYFNPVVKRIPFTTMFTSRGCPGRCVYCSSPPFYGRVFRAMSAERVIKEMEVVQSQGYREVFFRDEIFTVQKKRTMDICQSIIKKKLDLSWIVSARIGSVDFETMKLMKEAGCHMIRFGVESGSDEILKNIAKGITVKQIGQTFELIHKVGLDTHAHLMIGTPGETHQTINQTIKLLKKIKPTIITCGICTPYPGTKLFDMILEKYSYINDGSECDLSHLHTRGYYNEVFCNLSPEELTKAIKKIYRSFYFRPKYVFDWLRRIKSMDELKRIILAGTQVFDFVVQEKN